MRILLTGVNSLQCGNTPRLNYISSIKAIKLALEASGHQVEARTVKIGESLTEYDKVVVFLATLRGFVARFALGALWASWVARQRVGDRGNKLVYAFDDWQTQQIVAGIKHFYADADKLMEKNPFNYDQIEEARNIWPDLKSEAAYLATSTWNIPCIVPAFEGGDLSLLGIPTEPGLVQAYNPASFFKGMYGTEQGFVTKDKAWVSAALHNHGAWLKKQKLTWNCYQFGSKALEQPRVTEAAIYGEYAKRIGCLSPAYKTCGSGWWRARYGLSADAFCVAAGDPKEMNMPCFTGVYGRTPAEVESLDTDQLMALALKQREAYYDAAGTKEQAAARVCQIIGVLAMA